MEDITHLVDGLVAVRTRIAELKAEEAELVEDIREFTTHTEGTEYIDGSDGWQVGVTKGEKFDPRKAAKVLRTRDGLLAAASTSAPTAAKVRALFENGTISYEMYAACKSATTPVVRIVAPVETTEDDD